ncbi:MAG TPA: GNAT family N-acetyltransferase [Steroidobacteraceae bacterium]|nr:GNAT family N-acetyltransferase [Steroidobacteraceae bacterium]
MAILIRDPVAGDETAWRRLWAGYCEFYQSVVPADVTDATWRRLLDPKSPIVGRVAELDGAVVGFTHCVMHEGTWAIHPIGYLEDLYVDPGVRGHGVGRLLLQDLVDRGRQGGWEYLYWHTQAGNATARRLYDTFTLADDFVKYRVRLR